MANSEKEFWVCAECGCMIEDNGVEEMYTRQDGENICESCRENYYLRCEDCGELVHQDNMVDVEGNWVCESCLEHGDYFQCDDCGEWYRLRDRWGDRRSYTASGGGTICQYCVDDHYYICHRCGEAVPFGDEYEEDDEFYCGECYNSMRRGIHEYGYKPEPKFKNIHDVFFSRVEKDKLYFGVELEVDDGYNRETCAGKLVDACEDIYCKRDGSLHRGIEIVTHPLSLAYHTEVMPWAALGNIASQYGYSSEDTRTCGLHIHVGVDGFGYGQEDPVRAKLVMLVCRFWDQLVKFSRRRPGELGEWAEKPRFEWGRNEEEAVENALATEDHGRYQAVNLTNSNTVEFRLFKGSLSRQTILAAIQLVSNFCHYSMDHPVEDVRKSQWLDVALYESYPELDSYLKLHELDYSAMQLPEEYKVPEVLEVGDTVMVTGLVGTGVRWMNGLFCRVVVIEGNTVGVDTGAKSHVFSTLGGRLPENTGTWLMKRNLKIVKKGEKEECA